MQLKVYENEEGILKFIGIKEFKPAVIQASKWVRQEVNNIKTIDVPQTTNGLKIAENLRSMIGSLVPNALGFFHTNSNSPSHNAQFVGIYTTAFNGGHGLSIIKENFMKVCALFTARKTIKNTWANHYDEYSSPITEHPEYSQWNNDAVVYTLFNNKSNQSSLRNIQYTGKNGIMQTGLIIKNEFFFLSKEEMKQIADASGYNELYNDVKFEQADRYVYTLFLTMKLSDDAKHILELAKSLVYKSISYRQLYSKEHPELHLDSWDAGYVQLKGLWKECLPEEFKQFREEYLKFEKRMREGVYKFGFLPNENIEIEQEVIDEVGED